MALQLLLVWYRVARQRAFLVLAASLGLLGLITFILPPTFWYRASTIVPAVPEIVSIA